VARVALVLALAGCGLASKDYDITEPFQAGGGPPGVNFQSSQLTGPLSADVSRISSVTLKAARIEPTDPPESGDIAFISGATISIGGTTIATLAAPPPAGARSVQLHVEGTELKPFLQRGSLVSATINYDPTPITARSLQLVLTLHGSLF
jgi:hypothetical protein